MSSRIVELFGYAPSDTSDIARQMRDAKRCPFIGDVCQKSLSDKTISGVCTLQPMTAGPVICCPYRLYSNEYRVLSDVARIAFKGDVALFRDNQARTSVCDPEKIKVAVFGKRWGKELRLPTRGRSGAYFVDWVLARLGPDGNLLEFVAVEVQSIDTTGNYRGERQAYLDGDEEPAASTAGFNWENVNKRILPQIIYKGHVLRRERLCQRVLFFVCPAPVYHKIRERLGGNVLEYKNLQPGSLSIMWYDVGATVPHGAMRELVLKGDFMTTVDQIALAFTSPSNLPADNVYEAAILQALRVGPTPQP